MDGGSSPCGSHTPVERDQAWDRLGVPATPSALGGHTEVCQHLLGARDPAARTGQPVREMDQSEVHIEPWRRPEGGERLEIRVAGPAGHWKVEEVDASRCALE